MSDLTEVEADSRFQVRETDFELSHLLEALRRCPCRAGPSTVAPRFAPVRCSFRFEDAYSGGRFASSKPRGTAAAKRLAPPTFVEMSHAVEAPGPQICLNYVRRHGQNASTSMRQDMRHEVRRLEHTPSRLMRPVLPTRSAATGLVRPSAPRQRGTDSPNDPGPAPIAAFGGLSTTRIPREVASDRWVNQLPSAVPPI